MKLECIDCTVRFGDLCQENIGFYTMLCHKFWDVNFSPHCIFQPWQNTISLVKFTKTKPVRNKKKCKLVIQSWGHSNAINRKVKEQVSTWYKFPHDKHKFKKKLNREASQKRTIDSYYITSLNQPILFDLITVSGIKFYAVWFWGHRSHIVMSLCR